MTELNVIIAEDNVDDLLLLLIALKNVEKRYFRFDMEFGYI